MADLSSGSSYGHAKKLVTTYDYRDASGALLHQTVRYYPKDFKQRRPDGKGDWDWSLKGLQTVLYRLPELLAVDLAAPVFICEGEKAVDAVVDLGMTATCSPLGAGKWQAHHAGPLRGRHVVVLPDNDVSGRKHAQQVAASLTGQAASVKVVELPGLPEKGDAYDWVAAGGTAEKLRNLAEETPAWTPAAAADDEVLETDTLDNLMPRPLEWEVPDILPRGKVAVIAGDGDNLKSTLTLSLTADITTGRPAFGLHYDPGPPGDVLLVNCEDGWEDTIVPRLIAAGADLKRCRRVRFVRERGGNRKAFTLANYKALETALVRHPQIRAVIVDPASAFCGGVDDHKDSALRGILGPLSDLAQRRAVLILLVKHLNRAHGVKAGNRIMGSVAWRNASRAAFIVLADPAGEQEGRRLLLPNKGNLARRKVGLAFRPTPLPEAEGLRVLNSFPDLGPEDRARLTQQLFRLEFLGTTDANADEMLAAAEQTERGRSRVDTCADWLHDFLKGYAFPDAEIIAAAKAAGFTEDNVRKAKTALRKQGVLVSKPDGKAGAWWNGKPEAMDGGPDHWNRRPSATNSHPHTPQSPETPQSPRSLIRAGVEMAGTEPLPKSEKTEESQETEECEESNPSELADGFYEEVI
jgi:hypothetical protein